MRHRCLIVVLQSRQPLTVNPAEAFAPADHDVLLVTDGQPEQVLREDVTGAAPATVVRDRSGWRQEIADRRAGRAVEIVTNDEYCLTDCARLRAAFGLAARHPGSLEAYRDKVVMKQALRAAGVRVPRFVALEPVVAASPAVVRRLLDEVGIPAVVKPRREANSRGVSVLTSADELVTWLARHEGEPGWQLDQFVDGRPGHVNGLVRHGAVTPVQTGRYLGPLLGLDAGRPLGGATVSPRSAEASTAHELNSQVATALGADGEFVVHTEFMLDPTGEPVVIEVAARAPGAMVAEAARLHAGLNLEVAHLRMQAGQPIPAPSAGEVHVAWLWLPVLPGYQFHAAPSLRSPHRLHVRRVARTGHSGQAGVVGASFLLWNTDPQVLEEDIQEVTTATCFIAMGERT